MFNKRNLKVNVEVYRKLEIWYRDLHKKIKIYQSSLKNVYNSFANEKTGNARLFVDAESYFEDLYDSLMVAQESIFIAG
jgi:hypothetical protein